MLAPGRHALALTLSRDERARAAFASELRREVMDTLAAQLRSDYVSQVEPRLDRPSSADIHRHLQSRQAFRFYSALRVASQDLLYQVVRPVVER